MMLAGGALAGFGVALIFPSVIWLQILVAVVVAVLLLAFGQEVVYALHVVLAACALGSGLEGIVSIYHYRKGL